MVCLPNEDLNHDSLIKNQALRYISGGASRPSSVHQGFAALQNLQENDVILIHDGARPLVSTDLIQRVISGTLEYGAVIPGQELSDTIKQVNKLDQIDKTIARSNLRAVQTPQGFKAHLLSKAYNTLDFEDPQYTDESMLIEALGHQVNVVKGEPNNIKITHPIDLTLAEALLKT